MESPNKRFIHTSPSSLTDLMLCRRYFKWRNWRLPSSTEPLDFGSLFHKGLEGYYGAMIPGALTPEDIPDPTERGIAFIGAAAAAAPSIDSDTTSSVISRFLEYIAFYSPDNWIPTAVENPYSVILFENDLLQILFEFIVDFEGMVNGEPLVADHKTTGRFSTPLALTNQFMGICWALGINKIWMNRIGSHKKAPKDKDLFERFLFSFSQQVLLEWRETAIHWVLRLLQAEETGYWDADHSACWRCIFKDICILPAESREIVIAQEFVQRPEHHMYQEEE